MKKKGFIILMLSVGVFMLQQCKKDVSLETPSLPAPTPYALAIPKGFPTVTNIPSDNPLTVEGIALGKKLFYDPILSGNNTQSCASCHSQAFAFSDNGKQLSTGIDGINGMRNAPAIINVVWNPSFFWDGRSATLESQALVPVPNPIEMHLNWVNAVDKLKLSTAYPELFQKAFQTKNITKELVVKAIAQFERTFVSANSPLDKRLRYEGDLSPAEWRGYNIFFTEKGDCFHCHDMQLFTDNLFHNNGLDSVFADKGLGEITGDIKDYGKFKTPTLRNIEYTAPYMHDGRFQTLEEVVDFYSEELKFSSTIDPLMKQINNGGVGLSLQEKQDLIAFLKALSDSSFINNSAFAPN